MKTFLKSFLAITCLGFTGSLYAKNLANAPKPTAAPNCETIKEMVACINTTGCSFETKMKDDGTPGEAKCVKKAPPPTEAPTKKG